jgi:hypothetical protein
MHGSKPAEVLQLWRYHTNQAYSIFACSNVSYSTLFKPFAPLLSKSAEGTIYYLAFKIFLYRAFDGSSMISTTKIKIRSNNMESKIPSCNRLYSVEPSNVYIHANFSLRSQVTSFGRLKVARAEMLEVRCSVTV